MFLSSWHIPPSSADSEMLIGIANRSEPFGLCKKRYLYERTKPTAAAPHPKVRALGIRVQSVNRVTMAVCRSLPVCTQLRTYRCAAITLCATNGSREAIGSPVAVSDHHAGTARTIFPWQNTLQPPQKQRHLVHRNTDDVSRDWPDHKVFFRTGGDIGQRVAHHARLSGKPSRRSQPGAAALLFFRVASTRFGTSGTSEASGCDVLANAPQTLASLRRACRCCERWYAPVTPPT